MNTGHWTRSVAFVALAASASALGFAGPAGAADTKPFVYAEAFPFSTMDPAAAGLNPDMLVTQNTYDALTRYDEDAPDKILPALAASWTQSGNDWTFKLRDGVKFHDGKALTADDVKASIDRMLKMQQGLSFLLYNIAGVDVTDPATVVIHCKTANPWLPADLTKVGIVSAQDVKDHAAGDDLAAGWFKDHENGTGAYKVTGSNPGTDLTLSRNTAWWGTFTDHPVETFIDKFVTDGSQRFIGLKGGDYQLAAFISTDNALSLDKSQFHLAVGNNLWAYPNLNFAPGFAPTDNPDFRAALVDAFDYQAMVDYYKGYATTSNGPIPKWVPGSTSDKLPVIKQDLDKAKAELDKSGVKDAKFTCAIPPGSPDYDFVGQVLQSAAAQIGITIDLSQAPIAQIPDLLKQGKVNCAVYGEASNSPDPIPFFTARFLKGTYLNLWNYDDADMVKLIDTYSGATDPAVQADALLKMSQKLVDMHQEIWTVSPQTVMPMPNSVQGYKVDPFNLINVRIAALSYTP